MFLKFDRGTDFGKKSGSRISEKWTMDIAIGLFETWTQGLAPSRALDYKGVPFKQT